MTSKAGAPVPESGAVRELGEGTRGKGWQGKSAHTLMGSFQLLSSA